MDGQQICLKWNSFQSSIVTSFESLWEEQGFVDVTLASDGHCVQAHKIILSACSPFFKKIFQANPCQHPVIILQDVRFTEIESLLSFIYKGEVNIDQKDLGDLLRAAETLQIRGLSGTLNQSKSKKKKSSASKKASLSKSTDSLADEQPPSKKTKTLTKEEPRTSSPPPLTPFAPTPSARSLSPEPSHFDDPIASDADSLLTPVLTLHDDAFEDEDSMDKTARQAAQAMDEMRGNEQLLSYEKMPYGCLLPHSQVLATWAKSRTLEQLGCDLMKILFTTEERIMCNVNGKMGKGQFNVHKVQLIREALLYFSNMPVDEFEEQWKICVTKIDTANRGLKRNLVLKGRKAICLM